MYVRPLHICTYGPYIYIRRALAYMYVGPLHISRNPHIHISTNIKKPTYYTYGFLERTPQIRYSTNIKRPTLKETHTLYIHGFLARNPHTLYIWAFCKFPLFEEGLSKFSLKRIEMGGLYNIYFRYFAAWICLSFCTVDIPFFLHSG